MWSSGVSSAHQQPRNESCLISSHPFPGTPSGLVCDVNRQHISLLLHSGSGGTHSHSHYLETRNLLILCRDLNISLSPKLIPGRLNALADGMSQKHQLLPWEWTLHQEVANFFSVDRPLVDLFATRDNYRLSLYVSPVNDAAALAVDTLSTNWSLTPIPHPFSLPRFWRKSG